MAWLCQVLLKRCVQTTRAKFLEHTKHCCVYFCNKHKFFGVLYVYAPSEGSLCLRVQRNFRCNLSLCSLGKIHPRFQSFNSKFYQQVFESAWKFWLQLCNNDIIEGDVSSKVFIVAPKVSGISPKDSKVSPKVLKDSIQSFEKFHLIIFKLDPNLIQIFKFLPKLLRISPKNCAQTWVKLLKSQVKHQSIQSFYLVEVFSEVSFCP